MSTVFEVKPRPCALERVISRLSAHGVMFLEEGRGGIPDLTTMDFAAALAGVDDPIADRIVGALLDQPGADADLGEALDRWGWHRWREVKHSARIDGLLHARLCGVAVCRYITGREIPRDELLAALGVGHARWKKHLEPHFRDLVARLVVAEQGVARHVAKWLKLKDPAETAGK